MRIKTPQWALTTAAALAVATTTFAQQGYFPPRRDWQARTPEQMGMSSAALKGAIDFAVAHESPAPKDLALDHELSAFGREPYSQLIGPTTVRAPLNGLVVRGGYVVAEWGETEKVDMTFSVTKTFLSTVVGIAWDRGLIKDVHDRAMDYLPPPERAELFGSEHNRSITWDHLLRQTSDWEGTLWGKPDWGDRPEGSDPVEWPNRVKHEPGTHYKYNDVRVNVLALVALHVWRRPLPQVLNEYVMEPIGASSTWRWYGYDNSWIELDGERMQSMTGGGHWGGGMHISARDLARFGYLFLRNGVWNDRRIISEDWIRMARTPGVNPTYGFMNWFLNLPYTAEDGTRKKPIPKAPDSSVTFRGAGANIVYIDWDNDLVVVVRWIGSGLDEFIAKVLESLQTPSPTAGFEPRSKSTTSIRLMQPTVGTAPPRAAADGR
jgi:CubicO group peptidase (beta-lactamase class C family)